jgi:zinc protease
MALAARIALVLGLVIVASGCSMLHPAPAAPEPPIGPTRYLLPNGIPVIIEEFRASDVVAVQLWVQVGARDESAGELGLAHYLEHMLLKGTPTRPAGFVEREVEGIGGRINAGTSWDWTFLHAVLPSRQAADGIRMLADLAVNASLQTDQLEAEKQVVLEEMRANDDDPRRFLVRELFTTAFAGHPYGRPVIGTPEAINGLGRERLAGFYRRHYIPETFALVIVGAIDPAQMLRVARETFGALPRGGDRRLPPPAPPPLPRAVRLDLNRPSGQAYLGLAWPAPRLDNADTPALDLLMSILGRTKTSRLVASLRERDGAVNGINAGLTALEAGSLVTITAQLDPVNLERAERGVLAEIERVRERGVTGDELRRAITAAEVDHEFAAETAEGRARAYGRAETIWRLDEELIYLDRVRSVTVAQVQAVARRYLDPERYVRVALVPPRS